MQDACQYLKPVYMPVSQTKLLTRLTNRVNSIIIWLTSVTCH